MEAPVPPVFQAITWIVQTIMEDLVSHVPMEHRSVYHLLLYRA